MYKINKLQGYIVQHREYSRNFIITINGIYSLKIVNHYVVHLKHTIFYIKYTSIKKEKEMSYQAMKRHDGNLNAYY